MPRPVLIDTDAGVDDALAIIFAVRSPELSVKAITTVAGNARVEQCTRNVFYLLHLLGMTNDIPVSQGAAKPLRKRLVTAPEVHGRDGFGNTHPRHQNVRLLSQRAYDVIISAAEIYGKRLTIIALGPLTNIARAQKKNPAALRKIGAIVSMGGAFRVPGNTG
ncbi:MAG: nucleoside hydrolase, partial [Bacteroidota bacterium]